MVIPIGQPFKRGEVLYVYTKDAAGKVHSRRDMGVFFIPMPGAISSSKPVATRSSGRRASLMTGLDPKRTFDGLPQTSPSAAARLEG